MSDKSAIGWTDATWNPTTGCSKVSQGCKNCYAEREWHRLAANPRGGVYQGRQFTDLKFHLERLDRPLRWKKPRRVFVNSMSDLFHEDLPAWVIEDVFRTMVMAPRHQFQILTKRPERMRAIVPSIRANIEDDWPEKPRKHLHTAPSKPPWGHIHLGVSVEDQATADERIPLLLETPAAVRWVSLEPLLEPVQLAHVGTRYIVNALTGATCGCGTDDYPRLLSPLDWIVIGSESGPRRRPFDWQWAIDIRDQAARAGVPMFMKQGINAAGKLSTDPAEWPGSFPREYPA